MAHQEFEEPANSCRSVFSSPSHCASQAVWLHPRRCPGSINWLGLPEEEPPAVSFAADPRPTACACDLVASMHDIFVVEIPEQSQKESPDCRRRRSRRTRTCPLQWADCQNTTSSRARFPVRTSQKCDLLEDINAARTSSSSWCLCGSSRSMQIWFDEHKRSTCPEAHTSSDQRGGVGNGVEPAMRRIPLQASAFAVW